MARRFLGCALLVLASVWIPALAAAQSGNGSIAGLVRDTSGAVLPGVTVEASSPALIEKTRTVITDEQGQYKIIDLRPGVYAVTFTLAGFNAVKREGIELGAAFTATVNADLQVGALEETVTVSGQTSTVDVHNVSPGKVLSREVIDALPTAKQVVSLAALTVGVTLPPTQQNVGGTTGLDIEQLSIHGNRNTDMYRMIDGMRWNNLEGASGNIFAMVAAATDDIDIKLGGNSAEFETGGVQLNLIPKEGGNRFSGDLFSRYAGRGLQWNNLTDALRLRGLTTSNRLNKVWDVTGTFGGAIKQNKLWFFVTARSWGRSATIPAIYFNRTPTTPFYTADPSQPAVDAARWWHGGFRLTWEASAKNKFSFSHDEQGSLVAYQNVAQTTAPEAGFQAHKGPPNSVSQGTWKSTVSNRLLLEAGVTVLFSDFIYRPTTAGAQTAISITDLGTNLTYGSVANTNVGGLGYGHHHGNQTNQRFIMSFVTGSHAFRTGIQSYEGWRDQEFGVNGNMSYTFFNGVPKQVTLFATPLEFRERLKANIGLFAQDQWTFKRLTLNIGARFDYFNAFVPEQHLAAGPFVPARDFAAVRCVPCWKDLGPRVGAAYNLFGNGKTALKVGLGRYVAGGSISDITRANNPVQTSVNNATRTWDDKNGDFVPQGDFLNPNQNGELGPLGNLNFGKTAIATTYAPDVVKGFGVRPYNWQASASVEQELWSGAVLNIGYFRTWYGNFTVTNNLLVTPADYDPFSITAPKNPQLPDGGGFLISGLYDITPAPSGKFGQSKNVVSQAAKFGRQTEIYNGVDVGLNARIKNGFIGGGLSTGRTETNNCFVVNSPQQLRFCDVVLPFSGQTQIKVFGSYALPWRVQTSATLQSLPGIPIQANYVARNGEIAPSLGRDLAAGSTGIVTVPLMTPNTVFEGRVNQLDVRLTKIFGLGRREVQGLVNVYNLLNASSILAINTQYGQQWKQPGQILSGRLIDFGVQVKF